MQRPHAVLAAKLMLVLFALAVSVAIPPQTARADDAANAFQQINWTVGPATVPLGTVAQLTLPAGYRFTGPDGARLFRQVTHNIADQSEVGIVLPPFDSSGAPTANWWLSLSYADIGFVKDDEKADLDPENIDAMLDAMKKGQDEANIQLQQKGWPTLQVDGWEKQPFYDPLTHKLTWAINATGSDGERSCNYSSRTLGRGGLISADLVLAPEDVDATVPTYQSLVNGISFDSGQKYSELRPGDKIARVGLIGLITGGVAVAAVKGFPILLKMGAAVLALLIGIGAAIKKFFSRFVPKPAIVAATGGGTASGGVSADGFMVVKCHVCDQSNRIKVGPTAAHAVCGRCKANLHCV